METNQQVPAAPPDQSTVEGSANRFAYGQSLEVQRMAYMFGVSVERIREAVAAVGSSPGEVCRFIHGPGASRF